MNFVADESVDRQIVENLRVKGHSVLYVVELDPGVSNGEVFGIANRTNSILITGDKDFGELAYRQQLIHHGVVLIRLAGLSSSDKARVVVSFVENHLSELPKAFSVITPGAIRIRRKIA